MRPRLVLMLLGPALALGLGACGGDDSSDGATEVTATPEEIQAFCMQAIAADLDLRDGQKVDYPPKFGDLADLAPSGDVQRALDELGSAAYQMTDTPQQYYEILESERVLRAQEAFDTFLETQCAWNRVHDRPRLALGPDGFPTAFSRYVIDVVDGRVSSTGISFVDPKEVQVQLDIADPNAADPVAACEAAAAYLDQGPTEEPVWVVVQTSDLTRLAQREPGGVCVAV